jgi:hypothetical protein
MTLIYLMPLSRDTSGGIKAIELFLYGVLPLGCYPCRPNLPKASLIDSQGSGNGLLNLGRVEGIGMDEGEASCRGIMAPPELDPKNQGKELIVRQIGSRDQKRFEIVVVHDLPAGSLRMGERHNQANIA